MSFHFRELRKPDGRELFVYSTRPIPEGIRPTSPKHGGTVPRPHLRWHPLREEWVAYASHRQDRTFLPPKDYSPLAVSKIPDFPTEMPEGDYDVAVFENLFPSLNFASAGGTGALAPGQPAPDSIVPTRPADGRCEVVVFTKDPDAHLASLPVERIRLILDALAHRTSELAQTGRIRYVLPFENRGVEMGVTLHHPHGQIYAYPFVPPVAARMLEAQRAFREKEGRGLLEDVIAKERSDGRRMLVDDGVALSFVPAFARYPYETWVAPSRPAAFLHELTDSERDSLARVLKTTLLKHDGLWGRVQPYLMVLYQAPTDGASHPEAHVHFEIYPPYRTKDRLKYLAGTELGAGMFVNDSLPEEKAAELRAVETDR